MPLSDEDFTLFPIPASRPILVRPADAEWEVGFACLHNSPDRQIEENVSSEPVVVITKTVDARLPRQLGLSFQDALLREIIVSQLRRHMRLIMTFKIGMTSADV